MYLKIAYVSGLNAARTKVGAVAGPIAYAPRDQQENHTLSDKNMQLAWLDADRKPSVTGEESGIGMPSPGKEASHKLGGMSDGGYSAFSNGEYGSGSQDADRLRADSDYRKSDAARRAFVTNENIDQSFGPEPATTQPHGSRYAEFRIRLEKQAAGISMGGGVGGGLRGAGVGGPRSMMGSSTLSAPKPPAMKALDPRADKPIGMNLQHAVQTTSGVADMGTSIGSRFRRMDGNPM